MTENKRMSISGLLDVLDTGISLSTSHIEYAIQCNILEDLSGCLKELEQYRELGTVEELKAYKQGSCTNDCKHYDSAIEYVRNKAIDEFTHQLKENINQEFPSNYESTRPYFSLENARLSVDEIAEQMKAGGKNE